MMKNLRVVLCGVACVCLLLVTTSCEEEPLPENATLVSEQSGNSHSQRGADLSTRAALSLQRDEFGTGSQDCFPRSVHARRGDNLCRCSSGKTHVDQLQKKFWNSFCNSGSPHPRSFRNQWRWLECGARESNCHRHHCCRSITICPPQQRDPSPRCGGALFNKFYLRHIVKLKLPAKGSLVFGYRLFFC